ncbi:ATP-binding protein [Streptomyces sp. NBC_01236]|uniref:ATP-binding protein n=1 Tax=Streptomyces sp. NBC_01236 TaxID=2903789 RepID=UPI002E1025BD|nr:ATP-binding protein [Streptomyces sp. NBC_01236]WSP77307.1 ATP-binding protein [Streptomyces sp. NBC_01236]
MFEYRVAALDLVALLCGVPVPGLEVVPDSVSLQKASTAPLDDVVASNGQGPYRLLVERQVKRTLAIAPSQKAWRGVIRQCLESLERFGPDIDADRRRLGVTAAGPAEDLEALRDLAASAEAQATVEDFLQEMQRLGRRFHRVWDHLKATVAALAEERDSAAPAPGAVEATAFRIVRRLVVQVEPEGNGARYTALCAALEERLIPSGSRHDAPAVFRIIEDLAAAWGPRGGAVTAPMLRNRLSAHAVPLRGDPPARAALEAVESWTVGFLGRSRVKDRIGGSLRLDRSAARAELAAAINTHERLLVTGPAGAGKSALARTVARELLAQGVVVVALSLTEHTWRTVSDIEADVGARLATALAGAPTGRRVLLVDGAEQSLSDSGALLTHLLSLLPSGHDGAALWQVVAVAREQAADAVSRHLAAAGGQVQRIEVGDLADGEVEEILDRFPAVATLARSPRPARLLRNLYTVELLIELVAAGADPAGIVGEEDVAEFVYTHLVRRGEGLHRGQGHPDDRSDVFLDLAEAVAVGGDRFARMRSGTGDARDGLVSDGVLVRERSAVGFAHDVLEDYAVAVRLCERQPPDVSAAPRPRRLLRGIRVGAQMRLTRAVGSSAADVTDAWEWITGAVRTLAGRGDARWEDLPFEALFELGRPEDVLQVLAGPLLADGGRALLDAARRRLRHKESAWPLLAFLVDHAARLDHAAADKALHLLAWWLPRAGDADIAWSARVPHAVTTWYHAGSRCTEPAASALACAAEHLGSAGREVFEDICEHKPEALRDLLDDARVTQPLARHAPELLVRAARAVYLMSSSQGARFGDRHGVRDVGWPLIYRPLWLPAEGRPDPADLGPFAVLLERAEDLALALVGELADAETAATARNERGYRRNARSLVWPLATGEATFTGTTTSWQWPWGGDTVPGPVVAALAALRRWAHRQVDRGAPLGQVVQRVLGCGRSLALVAIAVEVLAAHADRVDDELDPVLDQLDLWSMPQSSTASLTRALPLIICRATPERQDTFRDIACRLQARHEQRGPVPAGFEELRRSQDTVIALAVRLLDASNYRRVQIPGEQRSVLVNDAVLRLSEDHAEANADLRRFGKRFELLTDAERAREDGAADVQQLFERWAVLDLAHQDVPPLDGTRDLDSITAAVAAAVVRAAAEQRGDVEPWQVRSAVSELVTAAATTTPAVSADLDTVTEEWDPMAPDRSAALGLPLLLATPDICRKAGIPDRGVRSALLQLAGSAYTEVRALLGPAMTAAWRTSTSCAGADDPLHTGVLAVLTEMVATAGLTAEESLDLPRQPYRLPGPLQEALAEGTPNMDLRLAAHAAAAAYAASRATCPHGQQARDLAEALSVHDQRTWTRQSAAIARDAGVWRQVHDTATAVAALHGQRARLDDYLDAFDTQPQSLAGLLLTVAGETTSEERVGALIALWPELIDRYRSCQNSELGRALLPLPVDGAPWTRARVRGVATAWARAHADRPQLADHLMVFFAAHGLFGSQDIGQTLDVLGNRPAAVARHAHGAVAFLDRVLSGDVHRRGQHADRAGRLLDALAAYGHREALMVQHRLEETSGLN